MSTVLLNFASMCHTKLPPTPELVFMLAAHTACYLVCNLIPSFLHPSERSEREQVQSRLCEVEEECGLLRMEVEELTGKIERLTDECQERSDQANQWYKALQVGLRCIHSFMTLMTYCTNLGMSGL